MRIESTKHGLSNRKYKDKIDVQLILGAGGDSKLFFAQTYHKKLTFFPPCTYIGSFENLDRYVRDLTGTRDPFLPLISGHLVPVRRLMQSFCPKICPY